MTFWMILLEMLVWSTSEMGQNWGVDERASVHARLCARLFIASRFMPDAPWSVEIHRKIAIVKVA